MERRKNKGWNAKNIRALRYHLQLTQSQLADELGIRQQTVSEWETGAYAPRGTSCTLLSIVAERAEFRYRAGAVEAASDQGGHS